MASSARYNYLSGLRSFEAALQESCVIAADAEGAFLRRGLAVSVYSLLERFVEDRVSELIAYVNAGSFQYSHLPTEAQIRLLRRTLDVGQARAKYIEEADLPAFLAALGTSISAASGPAQLSPHGWLWTGSNMGVEDYKNALRHFHIPDAFGNVLGLTGRVGYPTTDPATGAPIDLRAALLDLLTERNAAAHDAGHQISSLWLRGMSDTVTRLAVGFDALASTSAMALRNSLSDYVTDRSWGRNSRVAIRRVAERPQGKYAEYTETRVRAVKVSNSLEDLVATASARCGPSELLVIQNRHGKLDDWSFPAIS